MLDSSHALDFGGTTVNVVKINQDNFGSIYYGRMPNDDVVMLTIAHTLPKNRGGGGESHLVKITVESYADGVYTRTTSAWTVIKTFDGTQVDVASLNAVKALQGFLADGDSAFDNTIAVIGRQS